MQEESELILKEVEVREGHQRRKAETDMWTCLLNLEWVNDIFFSELINKNKWMRKTYYANYDYIHPAQWYAFKHSGVKR